MDIDTAISIIESVPGVTDISTPIGEAWEVILNTLGRTGQCDPQI